jgi:hypothetical protein
MNREEFDNHPNADKSDSNIRCYFHWGWCPSPIIDLLWINVEILSEEVFRGMVFSDVLVDEVKDWFCENIETRWTYNKKRYSIIFYFEEETDAVAFKLRWL